MVRSFKLASRAATRSLLNSPEKRATYDMRQQAKQQGGTPQGWSTLSNAQRQAAKGPAPTIQARNFPKSMQTVQSNKSVNSGQNPAFKLGPMQGPATSGPMPDMLKGRPLQGPATSGPMPDMAFKRDGYRMTKNSHGTMRGTRKANVQTASNSAESAAPTSTASAPSQFDTGTKRSVESGMIGKAWNTLGVSDAGQKFDGSSGSGMISQANDFRRHLWAGSGTDRAKKIGATAFAVGSAGRMVSGGGTPVTDEYGNFDIAGVPFI